MNKIYFDAYQQESTPGGERFPKATEAINRDIYKGVLVMNYYGAWRLYRLGTGACSHTE